MGVYSRGLALICAMPPVRARSHNTTCGHGAASPASQQISTCSQNFLLLLCLLLPLVLRLLPAALNKCHDGIGQCVLSGRHPPQRFAPLQQLLRLPQLLPHIMLVLRDPMPTFNKTVPCEKRKTASTHEVSKSIRL